MREVIRVVIMTVAFGLLVCFTTAAAEELSVVACEASDMVDVFSVEGVKVYAVMENGLLVGSTPPGDENLKRAGYSSTRVGKRRKGSEYFLLWIEALVEQELPSGVEILYRHGGELIVVVDGDLPHSFFAQVEHLLHISFVPLPTVYYSRTQPEFKSLTKSEMAAIVDRVSQDSYTSYIQRLQDFVTRYSYTDSCRAAEQWALGVLGDMGLETELFPYTVSKATWYNAIGRKVGTLYPDSIYMIIAHIDAISGSPFVSAPGAEDNGSGSACVLEAARVLRPYRFDCTIEFVLVSGEELGLYGSTAYAQHCYDAGRNIAGVLNFDMVSYEGGYGWDINIFSDQYFPAEVALADLFAQLVDDHTAAYSYSVYTNGPFYGSDHYPFSVRGYPAPFAIDCDEIWSGDDWYPWYHSTSDVIFHLDLDFGTEVVKGAVATLATAAGLSCRTVEVTPDGLGDFPTVQSAIDSAGDCDVILLANGVYAGPGNRDIDFGGKCVTVRSRGGDPDSCVIDCQGAGRGFLFQSGESSGSVIEGVTISSGYAPDGGGGIRCQGASPRIVNCRIVGNDGGGIACVSSSPIISGCVIAGNTAGSGGGGVLCENSWPTIDSCTIAGNRAQGHGGGIACENSTLLLERSILWGNCASGSGEEAYVDTSSSFTVACSDVDSSGVVGAVFWDHDNIFSDPLFCGPASCDSAPTATGDYSIDVLSPCTPYAHPACGLVGALGLGCDSVGVRDEGETPFVPTAYHLSQNFPNPFNPLTEITYSLPQDGQVRLEIYDLLGRRVATLVDEKQRAGLRSAWWDASSFSSGVYLYRLRAMEFVETRRMVLVK